MRFQIWWSLSWKMARYRCRSEKVSCMGWQELAARIRGKLLWPSTSDSFITTRGRKDFMIKYYFRFIQPWHIKISSVLLLLIIKVIFILIIFHQFLFHYLYTMNYFCNQLFMFILRQWTMDRIVANHRLSRAGVHLWLFIREYRFACWSSQNALYW